MTGGFADCRARTSVSRTSDGSIRWRNARGERRDEEAGSTGLSGSACRGGRSACPRLGLVAASILNWPGCLMHKGRFRRRWPGRAARRRQRSRLPRRVAGLLLLRRVAGLLLLRWVAGLLLLRRVAGLLLLRWVAGLLLLRRVAGLLLLRWVAGLLLLRRVAGLLLLRIRRRGWSRCSRNNRIGGRRCVADAGRLSGLGRLAGQSLPRRGRGLTVTRVVLGHGTRMIATGD